MADGLDGGLLEEPVDELDERISAFCDWLFSEHVEKMLFVIPMAHFFQASLKLLVLQVFSPWSLFQLHSELRNVFFFGH